MARAYSSCEKYSLRKLDHKWSEDILNFSVVEASTDGCKTSGCLFSNNSLILLGKLLQQRQEHSFVIDEMVNIAKLLCDSKKNLIIFIFDQF